MKDYNVLLTRFLNHLQQYNAELLRKQPAELYQPCNYILSLGGKRLRPLLALIACDLFNGDVRHALNSALAVELFHNFSLIHDDILDEAPLRRNQPTVHTKWNTNIAILSGDVMIVEAMKVLGNYPAGEFKKLSVLFNTTAIQVCEGQQMDMNFETAREVTTQDYIRMIDLKTAVLLGCSLKMGAINAGAAASEQKLLYEFGENLGIAFQLLDDYLDAFATNKQEFGKKHGGDIIANKKTYLLLKTIELADSTQRKQIKALVKLKAKDADKKLAGMLALMKATGAHNLCLNLASDYTNKAISSLEKIKASKQKKDKLKTFALQLVKRQS